MYRTVRASLRLLLQEAAGQQKKRDRVHSGPKQSLVQWWFNIFEKSILVYYALGSVCFLYSICGQLDAVFNFIDHHRHILGAHWLSGRVLDSRPRGRAFEPHRRHCVVSLSKTHKSLLSTGSTQEDPSLHN